MGELVGTPSLTCWLLSHLRGLYIKYKACPGLCNFFHSFHFSIIIALSSHFFGVSQKITKRPPIHQVFQQLLYMFPLHQSSSICSAFMAQETCSSSSSSIQTCTHFKKRPHITQPRPKNILTSRKMQKINVMPQTQT